MSFEEGGIALERKELEAVLKHGELVLFVHTKPEPGIMMRGRSVRQDWQQPDHEVKTPFMGIMAREGSLCSIPDNPAHFWGSAYGAVDSLVSTNQKLEKGRGA